MIGIGLLGYGTVGQAFTELVAQQDRLSARVVLAAVRDPSRPRPGPRVDLTTDPLAVVDHPEVDVVVDVMGGLYPAVDLIERALSLPKPVITANKEVMAEHGPELLTLAYRHGVLLAYEAAVGGGIPLVDPLASHFAAAPVDEVLGVLNGTSNYILSCLEQGETLPTALERAQALGYAERDPSADLSGQDVTRKLVLVIRTLFGIDARVSAIPTAGLTPALGQVIPRMASWGYRVKLVARALKTGEAQVWPTLVPAWHFLAQLDDVDNALGVSLYGEWFWSRGPGAGGRATALSLFADLYRWANGARPRIALPGPSSRVRPLVASWLAFPVDPDRPFHDALDWPGSVLEQERVRIPSAHGNEVAAWLESHPGLTAFPLLVPPRLGVRSSLA